jgi:hypothetical protein
MLSIPLCSACLVLMGMSQPDGSVDTSGEREITASPQPDCREISRQIGTTSEELDSLEVLKQRLDSLERQRKRFCLADAIQSDPAPEKAFRSDSSGRFDFTPSFLGAEFSGKYSPLPVLTFTIYQGLSTPYWKARPWSYSGAVKVAYHGGYDFDSRNRSGPVISRFQNPLVFVENYFDSIGGTGWSNNIYAGWAHESNGQFLETSEDAARFDSINGRTRKPYYPQDFASMGWNYWWVRIGFDFRDALKSGAHENSSGFAMELRYHVNQTSWFRRSELEDTSLFDGSRTSGGIRGYDGFRLAVWTRYEFTRWLDALAIADFQTSEIRNDLMFRKNSWGVLFCPVFTIPQWNYRLPLFIGASITYKHELAHYTERTKQVNAGVLLSTSSLIQDNLMRASTREQHGR